MKDTVENYLFMVPTNPKEGKKTQWKNKQRKWMEH